MIETGVTLRRATPDDIRPAFDVSMAAMTDLFARQGDPGGLDPERFWPQLEPLLVHLAATAAEWWVGVDGADGSIVGYARSIERDGLFELTELFVRPDRQSAGLGRRLIEQAFPAGRGAVRLILATTDVRALARYYGAGTVVRFPIAELGAAPKARGAPEADGAPADVGLGDLEAVPLELAHVPELVAVETAVVGYPRVVDYPWLIEHRDGHLYRRDGRAVGFAFVSADGSGPVAALQPVDQVPILRHVEARAHDIGLDAVSFEVPMPNEVAMRHLLGRGFRIEPPLTLLMSSAPFGQFDRFLPFGPSAVL